MNAYEKRMELMKMPEKYRGEEVNITGIPKSCTHREHVKEYGQNLHENMKQGKGLLLWGNSSTGKSAIASMCLKRLFDYSHIYTGLWVTARRIPQFVIEGTMFNDSETMAERLISVDLLVIDEFIIHNSDNTFRQDIVEHIFRDRAENNKPTILTTNMTLIELNKKAYTFFQVMQEHQEIIKVTGHNFREQNRD